MMMETWRRADLEGRLLLGTACAILLAVAGWLESTRGPLALVALAAGLLLAEAGARGGARLLAKRDGLVTIDEMPRVTNAMVDRFYDHGFDAELGWIRKANTSKKDLGRYAYRIDHRGSRANPGHEELPLTFSTYGDSYAFCREVEDNETWQWYLAERTGRNVLNFGVGNYGLDQALLRLEREYPSNPTPIVVMGIVPQTIARNLSVWKHYNEFGNVMAFKPRYVPDGDRLRLLKNPIDSREKFLRIADYLPEIQRHDYFYERRFKREALRAPFLASWLINWRGFLLAPAKTARRAAARLGIMEETMSLIVSRYLDRGGVAQTAALVHEAEALHVFEGLVDRFAAAGRRLGFTPVLAMLPMRDDLHWIRRRGIFYAAALSKVSDRVIVVDAAAALLASGPVRLLYREWHYSPAGNQVVASVIREALGARIPEAMHAHAS